MITIGECFTKPTVAELLSHLRRTLKFIMHAFEAPHLILSNIDRTSFGIVTPLERLQIAMRHESRVEARQRLKSFCAPRPIRRVV